MAKNSKSKDTVPALEPVQEVNEADGEPIFHADEEEGDGDEQYRTDGEKSALIGVNDWGAITIEGGTWTETPPDTITVPLVAALKGTLTATRQDGHLSLRCEATGPVVAAGIIAVLPEGWRPTVPITAPASIPGAAGATVTISTDGTIRPSAAGDGWWFILQCS